MADWNGEYLYGEILDGTETPSAWGARQPKITPAEAFPAGSIPINNRVVRT